VLHLKKITKNYKVRQNDHKIQNGVENRLRICEFLLSKAQFLPDFKTFFCIRSVFLVSNFGGRNFFSGNQNAGLVQDGVILGNKSPYLKLSFFFNL
jgi:hypothetical protein